MALNGISTLTYKRDRQEAKLALAAADRAAAGKPASLDLSLLPTVYGVDDNSASAIINNAGPLQPGRPWTDAPALINPPPVLTDLAAWYDPTNEANLTYEAGNELLVVTNSIQDNYHLDTVVDDPLTDNGLFVSPTGGGLLPHQSFDGKRRQGLASSTLFPGGSALWTITVMYMPTLVGSANRYQQISGLNFVNGATTNADPIRANGLPYGATLYDYGRKQERPMIIETESTHGILTPYIGENSASGRGTDQSIFYGDVLVYESEPSESDKTLIRDWFAAKWEIELDLVFTVRTTVPDETVQINTIDSGVFDAVITYPDETTQTVTTWDDPNLLLSFASAGDHQMKISGSFPNFKGAHVPDKDKFISIDNVGHTGLTSMQDFADNMDNLATFTFGNADLSAVTSAQQLLVNNTGFTTFDGTNTDWPANLTFREAFQNADSCTEIDFTGASTPSLTQMRSFGAAMNALTTVKIKDLIHGQNMSLFRLFQNTTNIVDIDCDLWDITLVNSMTDIFNTSTLPTVIYDATLLAWEAQAPVNALAVNFGNSLYTEGGLVEAARTSLINTYGWTILDGNVP